MKEYIERKAAKKMMARFIGYGPIDDDMVVRFGMALDKIPAADVVEVRHGWWLTKEYMYGDPDVGIEDMWVDRLAEQSDYYAYCSVCGKDAEYNAEGSLILSDYCPNCGAKMDGDGQ